MAINYPQINDLARLQAVSYFNNFARTLERIEQKLIALSDPDLPPDDFVAQHRKLIKLLVRATTNLRLFRERLFALDPPAEFRSQIDQLNAATIRYQRLFLMRKTLPENALERLYALPFNEVAQALSRFTQHYTETVIIPRMFNPSKGK